MIEETTSSCLVLDTGSFQGRIGYSGEESPRESNIIDPLFIDQNDTMK